MTASISLTARPGRSRLALGVVSLLTAAAMTASAATETANLNLGGKQFAHAKALNATSGTWLISPSKLYSYQIAGTVRGKGGALGRLLPSATSLGQLFELIKPGSSQILNGTLSNASGQLPAGLLSQTIAGTRVIQGDTIKMRLVFTASIAANGQLTIEISNVIFQRRVGQRLVPLDGDIVFGKGSRLSVSTAPIVEFKGTGQAAFAENAGFAEVTVWRQGNRNTAASVSFQTSNATAIAGTDYGATSGTIQFAAGEVEKKISVPLIAGPDKRGYRTFTITLSTPGSGTVLGSKLTNTVAIKKDP